MVEQHANCKEGSKQLGHDQTFIDHFKSEIHVQPANHLKVSSASTFPLLY